MIYIIIPAYNEEKTIGPVVRDIFSLYGDARVVVVDDGSTDQTSTIAKEAGATVLSHIFNRGQGAALKTGTDYALSQAPLEVGDKIERDSQSRDELLTGQGAGLIVHFDGDGQFEAKEIGGLIEPIVKGEVEVVLGSRFLTTPSRPFSMKGQDTPPSKGGDNTPALRAIPSSEEGDISTRPLLTKEGVGGGSNSIPFTKKYFILPFARLVNFLFTGLWLSDAHNGFRVFSRRAAETIEITQDRMAHNSEIVSQIKKHRLSFKEMPVTVRYCEYGQGIGGGIKIIRDLILEKIL